MEKGSQFFEVPDDLETKIRLLFASPPGWIFTAGLRAPQSLIDKGGVSLGTRFYYDGNIHRQLEIQDYDKEKMDAGKMDYLGIIVERKFPQFVSFSDVGLRSGSLKRLQAEQITAGLIRHGFVGHFSSHNGYYDDCYGQNGGYYRVILQPWNGGESMFNDESGQQPARVRIDWEGRYGGSEELMQPFILVCQELGLREYTPTAYVAKAA